MTHDPKGMIPFKAAIFDCDGILVDSERPWLSLIDTLLDEHGVESTSAGFHGLSALEASQRFAELAAVDSSAIRHDIDRRYSRAISQITQPISAAHYFLKNLPLPAAVGSNGRRVDVERLLRSTNLWQHFEAVLTVDDVAQAKPFPDLYLAAAAHLNVAPEEAVIFEDSPTGAQAARAAGAFVVGVNPDPAVELDVDLRVSSFAQLQWNNDNSLTFTP